MIYLLDSPLTDTSHSKYILDIIRQHTDVEVIIVPVTPDMTIGKLYETVYRLFSIVIPNDIVLCPWAVKSNSDLDALFYELSQACRVVAAAGNFKEPIENYTPAGSEGVITVGTLNKEGLVAALSNYSNKKEVKWVPGTNYNVGWKNSSGTSVSAALYAAFLAESIKYNSPKLLQELIENQKKLVFDELHNQSN